jgi:hypothetical protein
MIGEFAALRAAASVALLGGVLAACSLTDTIIDPRYDDVNRSAANARNEAILLNIVRASKNIPLNFIAFSKISGSTTAGGTAGLPKVSFGPLGITSQTLNAAGGLTTSLGTAIAQTATRPAPGNYELSKDVLSGTLSANTVFDISLLETGGFYAGLLKPVDLANFNYFYRQGYSRELLFWLFVEAVRETAVGHTLEFLNDPQQENGCQTYRGVTRCFRDMIDVAVASGLTVETRVESKRIYARLCFDKVLTDRIRRRYDPDVFRFVLASAGHRPRCKIDPWPHQIAAEKAERGEKSSRPLDDTSDTLTFSVSSPIGLLRYEIITRSTFGIYQYLGRILALGLQDEVVIRGPRDEREDRRIVGIFNGFGGNCFANTWFEGQSYCVPKEGADNMKRIFSLLAQLVALNTTVNDLAITPTVRIAQ